MMQGKYIITENTMLTPTTYRMRLAGDVSSITAPGQFINIRLDGHFLRRPISVCDVTYYDEGNHGVAPDNNCNLTDVSNGAVTIIYKVLGHGTEKMTEFRPGKVLDVLTGLGNGYDLSDAGVRPLLIGGGAGIPPLYLAARILTGQTADPGDAAYSRGEANSCDGNFSISEEDKDRITGSGDVTVILGFNSADEIYYADEFRALGCKVIVATADGSEGVKGYVTDAFRALLQDQDNEDDEYDPAITETGSCTHDSKDPEFTHFYTCGPGPMLRAVYDEVYKKHGISGQMSFEERMGCGFGACMGCSCRTVTGYKRICKDGPVLRTEEILW